MIVLEGNLLDGHATGLLQARAVVAHSAWAGRAIRKTGEIAKRLAAFPGRACVVRAGVTIVADGRMSTGVSRAQRRVGGSPLTEHWTHPVRLSSSPAFLSSHADRAQDLPAVYLQHIRELVTTIDDQRRPIVVPVDPELFAPGDLFQYT